MNIREHGQINTLIKINILAKKVSCILKSTQHLLLIIILVLYNAESLHA